MPHRSLSARAAAWSTKHRRAAVLGWLALVVVAVLSSGAIGQKTLEDEDTFNGESKVAEQAIADAGFRDYAEENVLISARGDERFGDPAFTVAIEAVVGRLEAVPHVRNVESPYDGGNEGHVSGDGRSVLISFELDGDDDQAEDRVVAAEAAVADAQRAHPRLRVEEFGDASANRALTKAFEDDFRKAETLSLPITLVILVIAFGALVAAGIPLLLGISAVAITLGAIAPLSQLTPVDESISSVILLIGLAVGVDYSMFYLRREMEERDGGRSPERALEIAAATSGRAVLVSGLTVMIAMSGMFLAGSPIFSSFAIGTMIVVAVAMLGSVTVLPAVLSRLGDRVEKGCVPWVARHRHGRHGENRLWNVVLDRTLRFPVVSVLAATALLLALASPALDLKTVNSGVQGMPRSLPIMQTYDRIQAAFPGGPLPALVVVRAGDVTSPEVNGGIEQLRVEAVATGRINEPTSVTVNPRSDLAIVALPLAGAGTDQASNAALAALRDDVIPRTIGQVEGVQADVGGMTAISKDFNDTMATRAPIVFAFVLTLAFVLLLVTFRSIVIPVKAILLNLLSVAAAYGILTWTFQEGHLEGVLGFTSIGGITSWLPLFLFVVLFGLSMDYHVFILSRVREAVLRGQRTDEAVVHGIKSTAGVVTSAAAVMIAVFSIFATLSALDFKMMGVGLAVAVLLDATIVRAVLLPAAMKLLGEWNWYLPPWLEWLPRVDVEAPAPATDVEFGEPRVGVPAADEVRR